VGFLVFVLLMAESPNQELFQWHRVLILLVIIRNFGDSIKSLFLGEFIVLEDMENDSHTNTVTLIANNSTFHKFYFKT